MSDLIPIHRSIDTFSLEERLSIRCRSLYQSPEALARAFRAEVWTIKRIIKEETEAYPRLPHV